MFLGTGAWLTLLVTAAAASAQAIPEGTLLNVRLRDPLYSYSARHDQPVTAVLVAPVTQDGGVLLPAGTEIHGRITETRKVGLGIRRERARMAVAFDRAIPPGGAPLTLPTRLHGVINARESLDARQRILGIRSTATLGYSASGWIVGAATADPLLMTFSFVGSSMILRFPESEIVYPPGTELLLAVTAPVPVGRTFAPAMPPVARDASERDTLTAFVATLPFRTATPGGKVSDLTNVLLIGDEPAIGRAFHAAGWATTDELNASTTYRTFRAMAENQGYEAAPMSVLQLDGRPPRQTWQKGLNTFSKRHHLRVFARDERWNGRNIWPISSTQDIGIGFSRKARTFIHLIDTTIDNERNKVVNDLAFTGCVDAVDLVYRPHVPLDARNATNERLLTDGRMAIVQLNACEAPRPLLPPPPDSVSAADGAATPPAVPQASQAAQAAPPPEPSRQQPRPEHRAKARGGVVQRGFKQFTLSMKHQFWRGNIVYVITSRTIKVVRLAFFRPKASAEATEPTVDIDGVVYAVAADPNAELPEADDAPRPAKTPPYP